VSSTQVVAPTIVSGNQQKYRREFNDPTLAEWDVVTGAGMTVNATGGNLVVTTGTTINSTTTLVAKRSFGPPFNAAFGFKISQKIVNQQFYLELVAENADGTLDETVCAAWRITGDDSVTATNARTEVRNGGAARLQSANIASQATQTADSFYEITIESDEVWFHSRTADSNVGRSVGSVRNTVAPDPNRRYRARIRIVNGGTAPASTTTLTVSALTVVDFTEIQASIQGGAGNANAAQGIPVLPAGTQTVSGAINIASSATVAGSLIAKINSAASTNATNVKASAARLYGYHIANTSAAWRYVKLHNVATAPTAGAAVAMVIPIPPGGSVFTENTVPVAFATGLGYTIVTGAADTDATAVGASEVIGTLFYI
jgi:hypothetical protein